MEIPVAHGAGQRGRRRHLAFHISGRLEPDCALAGMRRAARRAVLAARARFPDECGKEGVSVCGMNRYESYKGYKSYNVTKDASHEQETPARLADSREGTSRR